MHEQREKAARSRRRLVFPRHVDVYINKQSEARCGSRASYVCSVLERFKDIVDEGLIDGLKKFDQSELDALVVCFENEPATFFNNLTGKSDIPKFITLFRRRIKKYYPGYDATALERILLTRTTAYEFALLMEYLIEHIVSRHSVIPERTVKVTASCFSEGDLPRLRRINSGDVHQFKQLLLVAANTSNRVVKQSRCGQVVSSSRERTG